MCASETLFKWCFEETDLLGARPILRKKSSIKKMHLCSTNLKRCLSSSENVCTLWEFLLFVAFLLTLGSFLFTAEHFAYSCVWELFCLQFELVYLQVELLCLQLSFFAYSGKVCLRSTSTDCKQRSSTVSKKSNCKKKSISRFLLFVVFVCLFLFVCLFVWICKAPFQDPFLPRFIFCKKGIQYSSYFCFLIILPPP